MGGGWSNLWRSVPRGPAPLSFRDFFRLRQEFWRELVDRIPTLESGPKKTIDTSGAYAVAEGDHESSAS